ncbi:PAS domain-containing protein [Dyella acidisoli]|nr:PAS domain-containing protein [Dyella acidisoli]
MGEQEIVDVASSNGSDLLRVFDSIPGLVFVADASGENIQANRHLLSFVGQPLRDATLRAWNECIHVDDYNFFIGHWNRGCRNGQSISIVHRLLRFDGTYHWFHTKAAPVCDHLGHTVQWHGLLENIRSYGKITDELSSDAGSFRSLLEALPVPVMAALPNGQIEYANQHACGYSGLSQDDYRRFLWAADIHADDAFAFTEAWRKSTASDNGYKGTFRLRAADRSYRWCDFYGNSMCDQDGNIIYWCVVTIDVDDKLRLQKHLQVAQSRLSHALKMITSTDLSTSLAQEVNRLLSAVITRARACHRWLSPKSPHLDRALFANEGIIQDATSAAAIMAHAASVHQRTWGGQSVLDLNEIIVNACDLFTAKLRERDISLQLNLTDHMPPTWGNPPQMQHVLMRVIQLGMDSIEASNADTKQLIIHTQHRSKEVFVNIIERSTRTGYANAAVQPDHLADMDGLEVNLAACRSIIESHAGRMWTSRSGNGDRCFSFSLPIHENG